MPFGFDDRDNALFGSRVRLADVLGGQLVDDRPGGVSVKPLDDPATDDDRLDTLDLNRVQVEPSSRQGFFTGPDSFKQVSSVWSPY